MSRLFVALDLPDYACNALQALYEEHRGVGWVPPTKLHLTLKFIGPADTWLEEQIIERLRAIEVSEFLLPLGGVGFFPPKGAPRVIWAGVGNGHPHLFQLQHRIENGFPGLPIELSNKVYKPHITLARCQPSAAEFVRQFIKKHRDFTGPPIEVRNFVLMRSEPGRNGHLYETRATFPLKPSGLH